MVEKALEEGTTENADQLRYSLGWVLYWYRYNPERVDDLENSCLDYYCSCVELQQKSIFTFLWFWNRTTGGVKPPGQLIAQMAWEQREDNLVKAFEEPRRRSARLKRIKK
jgi:hypothetical protein